MPIAVCEKNNDSDSHLLQAQYSRFFHIYHLRGTLVMRTLSALLLGSSMLFSAATQASSLSLTTTLASDYVADGVSATDSQPALQIGLDYEHDSGLYAGIWTSNVDSDDHDTPNLELDYAIGYKHALTESIEGDVGITHYSYYHTDSGIDSDETNYQEWYAGLTLLENTSLYYYYADDSKVWDGVQRRIIAEHVQPLPQEFSLILTAERMDIETSVGEDYSIYRVGLARTWFDVDFTLSYWKNTLHDKTEPEENRFVLEASKTFDLL
jgi:uncharacterized protein (TIGR02001 family)